MQGVFSSAVAFRAEEAPDVRQPEAATVVR